MYHPRIIDASRQKLEQVLRFGLVEHPYSKVQEMAARMKDVQWDPETGAPSRALSQEEQKFIANELYMSRISFPYWCQRYCMILSDAKKMVPLVPWPSQKVLLDIIAQEELRKQGDFTKVGVALLKARQVGGTVVSEALGAHMVFLNARTQGIIASDHPDNTLKLWAVLLRIYDHLPGWMKPPRDAKVKATNLHLHTIESDVIAGSGNQKTTLGQGLNVDFAHLTEVSTWEHPEYIDADLMPAFKSSRKHHSFIILESTGNGGRGNWYHDQFQAARRGKSALLRALFISWFMRPGWKTDATGVVFTDEALAMAERVKREEGIELSREQLAWWQIERQEYEAKGDLETFLQEFPSTAEEAFQTGLRSVFPLTLRAKLRDQVKKPGGVYEVNTKTKKLRPHKVDEWMADPNPEKAQNKLIMWEEARPGFLYIVGVDASYGMDGGDNAAVEVLRVGNRLEPDEQVAEWCGNISPLELASVVERIGEIYKDKREGLWAKVAVEVNPGSPGIVTQTELMRRGYPNFYMWQRPLDAGGGYTRQLGWWTTPATRPLLTNVGADYLKKGWLKVNSPFFIEEMGTFITRITDTGNHIMEHAPNEHDDRLMSLFIALHIAHKDDYRLMAEERLKGEEQRSKPLSEVVQYQTLGLTEKEMWDDFLSRLAQ